MPVFKGNGRNPGTGGGPRNNTNANFDNCMIYVKRTWPHETLEQQMLRAEAVYAISKVFFEEIIPTVVQQNLTFSLN